jgi:hypothetical protein
MALAGAAPKRPQILVALPARTPAGARVTHAALYTIGAERIATGRAEIRYLSGGWTATISKLDRPGAITKAYFTDGVRNLFVHLPDGRRALARITATSFTPARDRTCELRGLARFS